MSKKSRGLYRVYEIETGRWIRYEDFARRNDAAIYRDALRGLFPGWKFIARKVGR